MTYVGIRSRLRRTVRLQLNKLLGPDDKTYPYYNENFWEQWDEYYKGPNDEQLNYLVPDLSSFLTHIDPVSPYRDRYFEVGNLDQLTTDWNVAQRDANKFYYPLTKNTLEVLGNYTSDGLDTQRIQYIQMGSSDWVSMQESKLIPCFFIESSGSIDANDQPDTTQASRIFTIILRMLVVQPDEAELTDATSTPIQIDNLSDALDFLTDPFYMKGISEAGHHRRGYAYPSEVRDAMITESQTLEGQLSPYEVTDFRLEITYNRDKQLEMNNRFNTGNTL